MTTQSRAGRARGSGWASTQLVALCRGEAPEAPHGRDAADDLVAAVRYHRIAPLAHVAYRDTAPELGQVLRVDRDIAVGVHLRASMMLDQLRTMLGDIAWAAFKGPVLSETAHPRPGLRTYHDVDVLVSPRDLREVSALLTQGGWTIADFDDMLRNPQTPGEMHWVSPSGLLVDLHWSMTNTAVRRARLTVPTDELLDRRREVAIGLGTAWVLDPVDAIVHVALHATLTGANRLLLLLDNDQLARQVEDWDAVLRRARQWRAHPHLALAMARAHRVLGTPVPPDLGRRLGLSPAFEAMCRQVDRVAPVPAARREPGLARMVARAVRPGAIRTGASVARSAVLGAAERVAGSRDERPRDRVKADAHALDAYLAAVESASGT